MEKKTRKSRRAYITMDLEADHAGYCDPAYDGWKKEYVSELLSVLNKYRVPLSVFVVANTLTILPDRIRQFQDTGAEFHLHSFSHNLHAADSEEEIGHGQSAFRRYFRFPPAGYRAPGGLITRRGMNILAREGFLFDASVFPSFWPRFFYRTYPTQPYRDGSGIIEIPFGTISPARIVCSLSWINLIGWRLFSALFSHSDLPDTLVVGFHLHDLRRLPSYFLLAPDWKWVYSRNTDDGLMHLASLIMFLRRAGYTFSTLKSLVTAFPTTP